MKYQYAHEIAQKYEDLSREIVFPTKGEMTLPEWYQAKKQYNTEVNAITDAFKKDLLEFLGVSNHPKAERLWELAWEHGHASGYNEVTIYADDFADLLR